MALWSVTISTAMVSGLPLMKLAMSGDTLTFDVPGNDGARFSGVLSVDGKSITGEFSNAEGSAPSTLVRTGEAKRKPRSEAPRWARKWKVAGVACWTSRDSRSA